MNNVTGSARVFSPIPLRLLRERWATGIGALAVAVVLLPALAATRLTIVDFADVEVYRSFGEAIAAGSVPYRDLAIEYPPAALPLFVLPALVTSSWLSYAIAFAVLVGVGLLAIVLAARIGTTLGPVSRDWALRTLAAGAMIGVLGAVALTRFDLLPAALVVATLYAAMRDRFGWAGVLLGVAIALKIYPLVTVPIIAAYALRRRGKRTAATFVALAIAVAGATFIPFLITSPAGVYETFRGQIGRSLQIESVGASILWLAVEAGVTDWPAQRTYYDVTTGLANAIQLTSTIAGMVALVMLWWRHWRGPVDDRRLVRYTLASIAAFVVFAKVLSPQYLLWLVVLVPALRGARANIATALLAGSAVATAIYFPRWFPSVVDGTAWYGLATIAVRNLLLVMFLLALIWRVERGAEHRGPRREAAVRTAEPAGRC
jgi:hypothetical protein